MNYDGGSGGAQSNKTAIPSPNLSMLERKKNFREKLHHK